MPSPAFQSGYPFSFRSYSGNGATTTFAVPFPYLAQAHVKVYVDGTLQLSGYSWVTSSSIQFSVAPGAPADPEVPNIVIRRETPVNPLVTFVNAASLKASNLNVDSKQPLYVAQEIADVTIGEFLLNQDLLDARDEAVQAAVDAALARNAAVDAQELAEAAQAGAETALATVNAIVDALRTTYDVSFSVPYLPAAGEVVGIWSDLRDITFPAGALGSWVGTPTAGSQDLTGAILLNDDIAGSFSIPGFSNSGIITIADDIVMTLGDVLSVKVTSANPSAPAGFGLSLKATLDNL